MHIKKLIFSIFVFASLFLIITDVSAFHDMVEVSHQYDLLELRERLGYVREAVTEVELDALAGSLITNSHGTTDVEQYLRFMDTITGSDTLSYSPVADFTRSHDGSLDDFLVIKKGTAANESFSEYELDFEDGLKSDIVDGRLVNFIGEGFNLLGFDHNFVSAVIDTSAHSITLELLRDAQFARLEEGEVRTFTLNGIDYVVEVLIIEDTNPATVTFKVNSEIIHGLVEGELAPVQGIFLKVSLIDLNEAGEAGSGDLVDFYVGTSDLKLTDYNYNNTETSFGAGSSLGYEQGVEIDGEFMTNAFVLIKGQELSNGLFELRGMKYRLVAEDAVGNSSQMYIPAGYRIREFLKQPKSMLANWDIRYRGIDKTETSKIQLDPGGDDEYSFEVENRQGGIYKWPFITNEGGIFKYGDNNDDFVWTEGFVRTDSAANLTTNIFNVGRLDYFILSDMDRDFDDTSFSHIWRYNSIDTTDTQVQFDDLATGSSKDFIYERVDVKGILGTADIVVGGNTYRLYIANMTSAGENPLAIDMDGDGNLTERGGPLEGSTLIPTGVRFTVDGGGIITFGSRPEFSDGANVTQPAGSNDALASAAPAVMSGNLIQGDTIMINLTTLSENFDENGPPSTGSPPTQGNEDLAFMIEKRLANTIGINLDVNNWISNGAFYLHHDIEEPHYFYGMTDYGVFAALFDPEDTDDAETVTIEYPLDQRGARVYILGDSHPREICDDGIDNDSDGSLDCNDPDCSHDLTCHNMQKRQVL